MNSDIISLVSCPQDVKNPALTIKFKDKNFHPNIPVYLPWNLSTDQFEKIFFFSSYNNPTSAFEFPALENWLTKLLKALAAQNDKPHPFYTNPYQIRKLEIEAADWFRPGKLGYMKLQSEITNNDPNKKTNWLPGAAFLRGNSVAVLVGVFFNETGRL
jgi:ADP-sugar diphosphatase